MSIHILSVGVSTNKEVTSSIEHATIAANSCIEQSGINMHEIEHLANVGIYRDQNMVEPAMAALIQKKIGFNLDYIEFPDHKVAFSFDLMNGAAGAINAFQIAQSLSESRNSKYFLVVSSDVHPSGRTTEDFPYANVGGAVLLENVKDDKGFVAFHFANTQELIEGEQGAVDLDKFGTISRHNIEVIQPKGYVDQLITFSASTLKEFISKEDIDISETALITTQQSPDFPFKIAEEVGINTEAVIGLEELGNTHSSSFAIGFDKLLKEGLDQKYKQVVFLGATGGLTCACALYKL